MPGLRGLVRAAWLATVLGPGLGGCSSVATPMYEMADSINRTLIADTLQPGDQVKVQFPTSPDWDHETLVRPNGMATFLYLGDFRVAGSTVDEVDSELTRLYGELQSSPDLTVLPLEMADRKVTIVGEVTTPGEVILTDEYMPLPEAIGRAGGVLKPTANLKNVLLVRWLPAENKVMAWRLDARYDYWGESPPVLLQSHDLVYVPHTAIDSANIWVDQYIRRMIPLPFIPFVQ
jgi:protein involved in polysaccharide export with SLBB domain